MGTGGSFLTRLLRGDESDAAAATAEVTEAAQAPEREVQFASLEGDEAVPGAAP